MEVSLTFDRDPNDDRRYFMAVGTVDEWESILFHLRFIPLPASKSLVGELERWGLGK
jgi:hypothetical protein